MRRLALEMTKSGADAAMLVGEARKTLAAN
jgi:hypothetical protein